ncbi:MAG TPA: YdeI/OmpD-associated family protein [Acidimicrobiales bacterium]|nr:YdeI/OmpD-associated family protein [Acidimicrobiales bacterium]
MTEKKEPQVLDVRSVEAWEEWLETHGPDHDEGVWLMLPKKGNDESSLRYEAAVESALCFGWIDGQGKRLDDAWSLQRMTPRRKRSIWSKINVARAERLIAEGRMRPAGLAEVERAKADGRWEQAYDAPSTAEVPADFLEALERAPEAKAFYETLTKRNTYPIVHRLQTARTPETRARRIKAIVEQFERGEKFYD